MARVYFIGRFQSIEIKESAQDITDLLRKSGGDVTDIYASDLLGRRVIIFVKEVQYITD